jgi:hypothetical protein
MRAEEPRFTVGVSTVGAWVAPTTVGPAPFTVPVPARTGVGACIFRAVRPRPILARPRSVVADGMSPSSAGTSVAPGASVSGWGGDEGGGSRSTSCSSACAPAAEVPHVFRYSRSATAKSYAVW